MGENRFQIRHGSSEPGKNDLLPYELGFDKQNKILYIKIKEKVGDDKEEEKIIDIGLGGINGTINTLGNTMTDNHDFLLTCLDNLTEGINESNSLIRGDISSIQKKISGATEEEIGYLSGTTSNIQDQLNNRLLLENQEEKVADLNKLTATGLYQWDGSVLNTPLAEGATNVGAGYCLHLHRSNTSMSQFSFEVTNGKIFSRSHYDEGPWTPWKRIAAKDLKTTEEIYPVGSVYITSTKSNPSSYLGGTWTLIDKEFKYQIISDAVSWNGDAIYTGTGYETGSYTTLCGHTLSIDLWYQNSVPFTDTKTLICTIKDTANGLGSGENFASSSYYVGYTDGGNSTSMLQVETDREFYHLDVRGGIDSVAVGSHWRASITKTVKQEQMRDRFCDKFYWKRTA